MRAFVLGLLLVASVTVAQKYPVPTVARHSPNEFTREYTHPLEKDAPVIKGTKPVSYEERGEIPVATEPESQHFDHDIKVALAKRRKAERAGDDGDAPTVSGHTDRDAPMSSGHAPGDDGGYATDAGYITAAST